MRPLFIAITIAAAMSVNLAAETVWIQTVNNITLGIPVEITDSISLNGSDLVFTSKTGETKSIPANQLQRMYIGESSPIISVTYQNDDAHIINPFFFDGVEVSKLNADVCVYAASPNELTYRLSGTSNSGSFKLYSDSKFVLDIADLSLANDDGAAINIQSGKKCTVNLSGNSNISDAQSYTLIDSEDQKACFFSEGQIIFSGSGSLSVNANYKHGICSDDYIEIQSGLITITGAPTDGIRVNDYFQMNDGELNISASGDAIDADTGYIQINGGKLTANVSVADTKAIKADADITINGGQIDLTISADQAKGIKTNQNLTINGGDINATLSGKSVVIDYDPSHCTFIKCDGNYTQNAGIINVTHTGVGGKGISVDGDATFNSGEVNILTSGSAASYTASTGTDTYSPICISTNGALNILGGMFNLKSTGKGGKCVKSDTDLTFGTANADPTNLTIIAETSGSKFGSSSGSSGGGGFRPGAGGGGSSSSSTSSSTSPKVIKAQNSLTVNSGNFTIKSAAEGGEGLESKNQITVNGGNLFFETYDDCLNAASSLTISGGNLRCVATGNDAIDSNSALSISGGVILASGAREPEEGVDVDNANQLQITGGYIVNQRGNMLNITTSQSKVPTIKYSSSISAGTLITITDSNNKHIFSVKCPQAMSQGCYITLPEFVQGQSYSLYTGGSVSQGSVFNEITIAGSFSGGTKQKTFTISSNLTSL